MKFLIPFLILFFFISGIDVKGQSPINQTGGRALGVSGASVTYSDVWSQYHNQAGLADLKGITFGFSFQNEFLIKELSTKSLAFALPTKSGVFGLNYSYFGYPRFNVSKAGLAFARNLGKRIAVGIQLDYFLTHIDGEYGNHGIAAGEIGILTEPIENLYIGAHLNNVWQSKREMTDIEYLPTIFKVGASYLVYEKALLSVEFEQQIDNEPIYKTGLEFELIEKLFFRAGIATNPNVFSFGPAYSFKKFSIDLSFSKHPVLGFSQGISIVYTFIDRI